MREDDFALCACGWFGFVVKVEGGKVLIRNGRTGRKRTCPDERIEICSAPIEEREAAE